jgi:hypothetical protein
MMVMSLLFSFSSLAQMSRINSDPPGATASIIFPDLELLLTPNDAICYGDFNGEIIASWTGGTAPYKIRLDNGPWIENVTSPFIFDGLEAGIYTVYLEDKDGLEDSGQAEIEEPAFAPIYLVCGEDMSVGPCVEDLEAEFNDWIASFTASGGTGVIQLTYMVGGVQVDLADLSAPDACGGSITVHAYAIDDCLVTAACTGTFTLLAPDAVNLNTPDDYITEACLSQEDLDNAFADWLDEVSYSGGCGAVLTMIPENPMAPDLCGGSITLTYTITSLCELPVTSIATFTVPAAPAVDLDVPEDYLSTACMSQEELNDAFADWLDEVSYSGGCGAVLTMVPENPMAPDLCGGSITLTYTITSLCELPVTSTATFTVPAAPAVDLDVPEDYLSTACMSQEELNDAFADWLDEVSYSGGCGAVLTMVPENPMAPDLCGGSITLTYTITSLCELPVTSTATFTVPAPAPVVVTPPTDFTAGVCMDQADIDAAFASWLASASITGGCNLNVASSVDVAPSACGSVTTLTLSASSDCEADVTATATFTVPAPASVVVTPPADFTAQSCLSQAQIDQLFADWVALGDASGGCNLNVTTSVDVTPSACGSVTTVTWTASSDCEADVTATATFTVPAPASVVVTPPADFTAQSCLSQAQIDQLFADWVALGDASGGCNLNVTTSVDVTPSACGSFTTVTWTASSDCEADVTATATFTVPTPASVVVTPPADFTAQPCLSQAQIDQLFADWVALGDASGGCNLNVTTSVDVTPSACGSVTTVTWTASSDCEADVTATATFTVPAPAPVVVTPPADFTASVCMDQADIDAAFATWLASASITGGCNLSVASSVDGSPSACGSVTTLTLSASSDCEADVTATATFTVPTPEAITAICPAPVVMPPCATMAEIMAAYEAWKDGFGYTGECFVSDNMADFPAMDIDILVGGTITFVYMVTGTCSEDLCTSSFTIPLCGDDGCTLTPGYWMTHSEFGPAPYDPTWALLPNGASTMFFMSGKTYYQVRYGLLRLVAMLIILYHSIILLQS